MTVLLEYVTALLEYLNLLLQGIGSKSGGVISTTYSEYIYHYYVILGLWHSAFSIPMRPPNLEEFEMKYAHKSTSIVVVR